MDDTRRRRFRDWYEQTYGRLGDAGRSKLIEDTGKHGYPPITKGRVAQLFDEAQPFGEGAAKKLALRLGLEEGFFLDSSTAATVTPPRQPPLDFSDRHEVSDSDWATLQDVKLVLMEDELATIRRRAEHVRQQQAAALRQFQAQKEAEAVESAQNVKSDLQPAEARSKYKLPTPIIGEVEGGRHGDTDEHQRIQGARNRRRS